MCRIADINLCPMGQRFISKLRFLWEQFSHHGAKQSMPDSHFHKNGKHECLPHGASIVSKLRFLWEHFRPMGQSKTDQILISLNRHLFTKLAGTPVPAPMFEKTC